MKKLLFESKVEGYDSLAGDFMSDFFQKFQSKHVFGKVIDEVNDIPPLFEELMEYILECKPAEGIFRKAGRQKTIEAFVKKVEKKKKYDLKKDLKDIHNAASVFKVFIREIPDPIFPKDNIPEEYREKFTKNIALDEGEREIFRSKVVGNLNKLNRHFLLKICGFLSKMAEQSDKTKMHLQNLALVFSPNIVKGVDDQIMAEMNQIQYMKDARWASPCFMEILMNYEYYFK